MVLHEFIQIVVLCGALAIMAPPLGAYMAKVYAGGPHILTKPLLWLERLLYRLSGVRPETQMSWKKYASAVLIFNLLGMLALLTLQFLQHLLPLNPENLPGVPGWLAINTAVSFVTNTNWQAYSGEVTMSHLTQMVGLGVQNYLSAATGMAVAVALARGLSEKATLGIGNFWQDCVRSIVYVLLPLSLILAVMLISQGVVQNFSADAVVTTLEGKEQHLPMGPVASQIAIKQLGTNGGGFFGVNSAHPFENPTPFSNWLEMLAILLIPAATPLAFGHLIGNKRHGYALLGAMVAIFAIGLVVGFWSEFTTNNVIPSLLPLEGKELRFGIANSVFWTQATTAASNGSVNAMISSMSPLAGGMALLNIMLGEVVFGGVGSGLYGMVMFAVLTVFIAGLMVGRTPEYLGKKIEAGEIQLAVIAILAPSILILLFAALASMTEAGLASPMHRGPHGLSEILYAFTSAAGNNGSAFAGLNANTRFYNGTLALCMAIGRFGVMIPVLAFAGRLAAKKVAPPSPGTFPLEGGLFVALLCSIILLVGALTFFPALSLGPIMEHFLMVSGSSF